MENEKKNEIEKIGIYGPFNIDEKNDYDLKNEEKDKDFKDNYQYNDKPTPFTRIPIKFITNRENINKKIIIFREKKILYSGNYYKNLDQKKYYFVMGENSLDLTKNIIFSFRIDPDPNTKKYPWIAFGIFNIQNENKNYIYLDKYYYQRKGLYCIDLNSNTCFDGKIEYEGKNCYKLDLNTIIAISYYPEKNLLMINDKNSFEIYFPNIPNNNVDLRICFIFNGEDRAIIDYH